MVIALRVSALSANMSGAPLVRSHWRRDARTEYLDEDSRSGYAMRQEQSAEIVTRSQDVGKLVRSADRVKGDADRMCSYSMESGNSSANQKSKGKDFAVMAASRPGVSARNPNGFYQPWHNNPLENDRIWPNLRLPPQMTPLRIDPSRLRGFALAQQ